MRPPGTLSLTTGAKINLFLRVLGRRPDGFHEIESIFHTLALADEMEVSERSDDKIQIEMEAAADAALELPKPEDNIVMAAARRLQELASWEPGASIRISKRIPVAGGMGGGSSNAAGALLALDRLWGLELERRRLVEIAAGLGSDVPYCVDGDGTALVGGRGENLARLPGPPEPLWFVLGISDEPLLTADVYAALEDPAPEGPSAAPFTLALGQGDATELGQLLHNDLEAPAVALRPRLRQDKEAMLEAGALGACVTGSGPTVFALAGDETSARDLASRVADRFDRVVVTTSGRRCVNFL